LGVILRPNHSATYGRHLNARPMRRLGVSRRDLFLELDRPH